MFSENLLFIVLVVVVVLSKVMVDVGSVVKAVVGVVFVVVKARDRHVR